MRTAIIVYRCHAVVRCRWEFVVTLRDAGLLSGLAWRNTEPCRHQAPQRTAISTSRSTAIGLLHWEERDVVMFFQTTSVFYVNWVLGLYVAFKKKGRTEGRTRWLLLLGRNCERTSSHFHSSDSPPSFTIVSSLELFVTVFKSVLVSLPTHIPVFFRETKKCCACALWMWH